MARSQLIRSLAAGVVGTAAMTAYQAAVAKLRGEPVTPPAPERWADAPPPAQVVKKAADAVGEGRRVRRRDAPRVANVAHWLYGIGWGVAYGLAARRLRPHPMAGAVVFGAGVWATSYAELVPLGIYEPPWRYPARELGLDLSYHLVYGVGVAATHAALTARAPTPSSRWASLLRST
jgi:uncharacterized membrane protein YagU involved in acid resistance